MIIAEYSKSSQNLKEIYIVEIFLVMIVFKFTQLDSFFIIV